MSNSIVARRYAGALVELCDERGDHEAVRQAFDRVAGVLAEVPEALALIANPTVNEDEREQLLNSLVTQSKADGAVGNLLKIVFDRGRFADVPAIHERFSEQLDGRTGRVQAHVVSAVALSDTALARIQQALAGNAGREVTLTTAIDAELIGGVVIKIGNTIYDASIRNHLERLRERMLAGTHG